MSNRQLEKLFKISRHKISKIKKENNIKQCKQFLTNEQKEYIIKNSFKTSSEISKEINVPPSTIRRIWQENNIKKKKCFNPDKNEFISLYEKYKSSRKLAEHYSVNKTIILNFAKKIGYINKYAQERLLTEQEIKKIIKLYNQTNSIELAQKYNCSRSRISQIWLNAGLRGKDYRQYYCNFDYFEEINSKDKAYFLGFIAADGCVYKRKKESNQQKFLSIAVHSKDEEILHNFLKYINGNNPIFRKKIKGKNIITPMSSIQIVSDKLCNDLKKYNILPRKTWIYYPTNIPKEYYSHFLRGFFDGDGCISVTKNKNHLPSGYQISIVGNKKTIEIIGEYIKNYDIKYCIGQDKRKYNGEFCYLIISNTQSKYNFIQLLYNDCDDLYLTRKKERCDDFINAVLSRNT